MTSRCQGPLWVPVALLALDVGRRLLSDLAEHRCADRHTCQQ
jgi:hypothetical protein